MCGPGDIRLGLPITPLPVEALLILGEVPLLNLAVSEHDDEFSDPERLAPSAWGR